jgi:hypothetical protein
MTGTINATIVGDDYQFDHANSFPGSCFEGKMTGPSSAAPPLLSTMNGPRTRASATSRGGRQRAHAGLLGRRHHAGGPRRDRRADDARRLVSLSRSQDDVDRRRRRSAAARRVAPRQRRRRYQDRDDLAIDLRAAAPRSPATSTPTSPTARWNGKLHVDRAERRRAADRVPEAWRVAADVGDAILGGTFDDYTLDTTINGTPLQCGGQSIDRATAKAMVTAEAIDVSSLEHASGPGYPRRPRPLRVGDRRLQREPQGRSPVVAGHVAHANDTQAIFAVQFDGAGTTAQPKGQLKLDFALTGGKAGAFIGAGDATADLLGDQARIVARLPSIGALINADVATASPYDYRATAQLDRFELARLCAVPGRDRSRDLRFRQRHHHRVGPARRRSRSRRARQHHRARCRRRRRAGFAALAAQRGRCAATMWR